MASPSTVSQSLLFKSQIFRHNPPIWKTTRTTKNASRIPATRRFPRVRLPLLPPHLRLRRPCLQIRHFNLLCLSSLRPLLRARSPPLLPCMSSLADSNSTNAKTVSIAPLSLYLSIIWLFMCLCNCMSEAQSLSNARDPRGQDERWGLLLDYKGCQNRSDPSKIGKFPGA